MFVALQKGEPVTKTVRVAVASVSMENAVFRKENGVRQRLNVVLAFAQTEDVVLIMVRPVRTTQTVVPEPVQTVFVVPV